MPSGISELPSGIGELPSGSWVLPSGIMFLDYSWQFADCNGCGVPSGIVPCSADDSGSSAVPSGNCYASAV